MVNIQRNNEFATHTLNRDVWGHEGVQDMVQCSFVFWQTLDQSTDGKKFLEVYNIETFPHIAIIDPRTGARQWQRGGDIKAHLLIEAREF